SGKATKYRLPEQPAQCVPTILATACVGQNVACHLGQTEYVVRRSPGSRETGASSGGRNPAEQRPIPIHPLGAPWPPRSIQGKMLIAISESRRPRRNSVRYPVNAGLCPRAGLLFLKSKLGTVMMRWITLGEPSGPDGSLPIRCKLKADVGASSITRRTSVRCALSRGKGAVASRCLPFQALANT